MSGEQPQPLPDQQPQHDRDAPHEQDGPVEREGAEDVVEVPFRRLSPLTPIARSGIFLAAVAFFFGREVIEGRAESEIGFVGIAAVVAVVGGLAIGFFSWWRTAFRITETELRLDTGLISRQSRRVRLDRIVAIDINQPLIARLLGLGELRIETATTDSEVSLAFLPVAEARRLREILLTERTTAPAVEGGPGAAPVVRGSSEPVPLVQVRTSWHLTSVIASPETIVLVVLGLVVAVLLAAGADLAGFGVGLAGMAGTALSVFGKLVGRWNWRVGALPTGVHVSRGLFNVTSQTFHVARLQGLRVREPVLWRPWGLAQLEISVAGGAGGAGEEGQGGGVVLPAAPRDIVWRLAHDLMGAEARAVPLAGPPKRASWLSPFGRPFLRWGYDDRLLVVRSGLMGSSTQVVPLARAQSLRVASGPLQRLLSLATVRMDSPDGATSLSAKHLPRDEARGFFDGAVSRARVARMPAPDLPVVQDERADATGAATPEPGSEAGTPTSSPPTAPPPGHAYDGPGAATGPAREAGLPSPRHRRADRAEPADPDGTNPSEGADAADDPAGTQDPDDGDGLSPRA
ncbi:PH domain-containing protein [Alteromonas gracilis]